MSAHFRQCQRRAWTALLCAAWLIGGCAAQPTRDPHTFSFALVGDAPYGAAEMQAFSALIARIDADDAIRFVLHAGDIKGGEPCSDELLRARIAQLQQSAKPVVYTPGDNEWADCHTRAAGRFQPLERLAFLRRIAFADPRRSLGRAPLPLVTQADDPEYSDFVENVRFSFNRVLFATVHVPGSNNALQPWSGLNDRATEGALDAVRQEQLDAFAAREAAALAWLDAAFDQARSESVAAIVVLLHANPRFDRAQGSRARAGYDRLIERLRVQAAAFGRPVLLAHGDHHTYLIDRPFEAGPEWPAAPRLVRLQTVGSPLLGWIRVTVEPDAAEPFRFALRL